MIDLDNNRLELSQRFGATAAVISSDGTGAEEVMRLTVEEGDLASH